MSALNAKHQRFVNEYLIDRNGTQAAIRAGYSKKSAKVQASRLLTNANILALVNITEVQLQKKLGIDQEWVRRRLMLISDVNSEMIEVPMGGTDNCIINKKMRDAAAANRATELLGKDQGMFTEKIELDAKIETETRTPESELELARQLLAILSDSKFKK